MLIKSLIFSIVLLIPLHNTDNAGSFRIHVSGLRNSKGTVNIGVYNKKENFPDEKAVIKRIEAKITEGGSMLEVNSLPFGFYAFVMMHDENDNKKMDYNWIGLPKEGYGFSRNPKIGLSAPSFDETKVELKQTTKEIKMQMKYM